MAVASSEEKKLLALKGKLKGKGKDVLGAIATMLKGKGKAVGNNTGKGVGGATEAPKEVVEPKEPLKPPETPPAPPEAPKEMVEPPKEPVKPPKTSPTAPPVKGNESCFNFIYGTCVFDVLMAC